MVEDTTKKPTRYRISDFCKMVGLPKSKIRFYEKYGLLHPVRDGNGYHYYTRYDAFRVNSFLTLLKYGFTIEKSVAMLDAKQSTEAFTASLEELERDLQHRIELLAYRKKKIGETLDLIRNEGKKQFEIKMVEPFLYAPASEGVDFTPSVLNSRMIKKLYSILEASHCARIIRKADLLGDKEEVDPNYVVGLPESAARLLGTFNYREVQRLELGRCLVYCRTKTREESVRKTSYRPMLDYIEANRISIRDDILLLPTFLNLDGEGLDIERIFVPIADR